ncbi:peptidase C39 family protein [Agromyces lapidis]|uniref:Peptidase C39 family protein n=1 Tax=Agromyces lapidis TaxID=279574 RepID=A0ABV5SMJ7_9MICO|nr:peptidase C39 family protein [Agromyces lapidis]
MTTITDPLLDDELRAALGEIRAERWGSPRTPYSPRVDVVHRDDGPAAAALTSRRSATAAVKIVDVWWRTEADSVAAATLVDEILARAVAAGDAAVKWEVPFGQELPAFAVEQGFVPLAAPHPSAPGTLGSRGYVRWLRDVPHDEAPYYAQTTLYTCGAVSGLLATEAIGAAGFGDTSDVASGESSDASVDGLPTPSLADRDLELAFWRRASNYPAIEPVGLGVVMRETLPGEVSVEVFLDHDGPVLIEAYTGFERDFRAELQAESLRQAEAAGLPVRRSRISIDEIARRIAGGELALLLVDEAPMHGETGPHWVLAHAAGEGVIVIEDPWISSDEGETWVDSHELPVAHADLDRMVAWGEAGYRGVVFVGRR